MKALGSEQYRKERAERVEALKEKADHLIKWALKRNTCEFHNVANDAHICMAALTDCLYANCPKHKPVSKVEVIE